MQLERKVSKEHCNKFNFVLIAVRRVQLNECSLHNFCSNISWCPCRNYLWCIARSSQWLSLHFSERGKTTRKCFPNNDIRWPNPSQGWRLQVAAIDERTGRKVLSWSDTDSNRSNGRLRKYRHRTPPSRAPRHGGDWCSPERPAMSIWRFWKREKKTERWWGSRRDRNFHFDNVINFWFLTENINLSCFDWRCWNWKDFRVSFIERRISLKVGEQTLQKHFLERKQLLEFESALDLSIFVLSRARKLSV